MMRYCLRDHLKVEIFGKLIRSHRDGGAFSQLRRLTSDFNWGDEETLLLISLYFFGTIWGLKSPRTPRLRRPCYNVGIVNSLFYVGSTRVRPLVRCMSGIITMNLLVGLEKILETTRKEMVMVGIFESSNHVRVDGKDI